VEVVGWRDGGRPPETTEHLNHPTTLAGRKGSAREETHMLTIWTNPKCNWTAYHEEVHRPADAAAGSAWSYGLAPAADVVETEAEYRVLIDLPGLDPAAIQLRVEKDTLIVRADRKQPGSAGGEKIHRSERAYGTYFRSFALPRAVDPGRVEAGYEHGVLTVKLPKREEAKARTNSVSVK
jgi:HSP20 family protein